MLTKVKELIYFKCHNFHRKKYFLKTISPFEFPPHIYHKHFLYYAQPIFNKLVGIEHYRH